MSARELLDINDARERFARAIRISPMNNALTSAFPAFVRDFEPARAGVCPVQVTIVAPAPGCD